MRKDKDRSFRQSSAVSCEPESSSRVTPETSAHFAQKVGEVRRRIRVPPPLGPDVGEAVAIRVRGRFRHRPPGQIGAETIGEPRGGAANQHDDCARAEYGGDRIADRHAALAYDHKQRQ